MQGEVCLLWIEAQTKDVEVRLVEEYVVHVTRDYILSQTSDCNIVLFLNYNRDLTLILTTNIYHICIYYSNYSCMCRYCDKI